MGVGGTLSFYSSSYLYRPLPIRFFLQNFANSSSVLYVKTVQLNIVQHVTLQEYSKNISHIGLLQPSSRNPVSL
jgi:hypothetical protein